MAIFPQRYFTQDQVAVRTGPPTLRAPYKAKSINEAFCGQPKGSYRGFTPSALGGVLTLAVGPEGYSIAKVDSQSDRGGIDVKANSPVVLDFTTAFPTDFLPDGIQVVLRALFLNDQETTAQIYARSKTLTYTAFTVGAAPAALDLSFLNLDGIVPGSLTLVVDVNGFGAASILDNGVGGLIGVTALPLGGTVDYSTGLLAGTTAVLTALSTIIVSYTRAVSKDEVLICTVTGTPAAIVVNAATPTNRDVPIAYPTVPFGYMPAGSIESLAAAVDILTEVAAARVDLQGFTHPNLKTRLDTDLGGPAMGGRLGRIYRAIRSNQYQANAGVSEINVSGSLSAVNRDFLPAVTLSGAGSETTTGAICDPTDITRNTCIVIDAVSGDRLIDNPNDRIVVFGRLRQEDDFVLDGALSFVNALLSVSGDTITRFTLQLQAGDTIQAPDGKFYEVASISNDSSLTLRDAYQGVDASSGSLIRRRFKLKFRTLIAGTEAAYPMLAVTQVQFFLPTFLTHATAAFDAGVFLYRPGERPVIPDASTSVQGKIALASASSPYVGSINLQKGGVAVAGGPFHTLNFTGVPGGVVEISTGLIDVANIGGTGPTGPGGGPGPTGPQGNQGTSITLKTKLSKAVVETAGFPAPAPVAISHTVNFGYTVTFLSGGFALHRDAGLFGAGFNDDLTITDIDTTGPTTGTIVGTLGKAGFPCDCFGKLYLDACGSA